MYDLTSRLELTVTSEDSRVLDALEHARAPKHLRDYLPERHEDGRRVDISFATLNWQKAVRDKNRPGVFVRKYFERWCSPRSPRNCAPATSRWPAPRSSPTGASNSCRGRTSRRSWDGT
ncbi:hypothetical protein ABT072_42815 [Streptomyces sp. NPDC002589]|uniref:hypothetical protein n=1 Tax=Streptomyces sp. NPDC002589 TaxID=3154420 RepID=UPI003321E94F